MATEVYASREAKNFKSEYNDGYRAPDVIREISSLMGFPNYQFKVNHNNKQTNGNAVCVQLSKALADNTWTR